MPSVVIIHAAEDALPARALAEKLRQAKLTPVTREAAGRRAARTRSRTRRSRIALWSPRSVDQAELIERSQLRARQEQGPARAHAERCRRRTVQHDKSIDLTGWRGEDDFPAWRELAKLVTDKAGVAPLPPPAPKAHQDSSSRAP